MTAEPAERGLPATGPAADDRRDDPPAAPDERPSAAPPAGVADRLDHLMGTGAEVGDILSEELETMEEIARDVRRAAPRWVAPVFGGGAILLLPWIVVLAITLPDRNDSGHWNVAWVGFDVALLFALARTAWLARQGRRAVELPAVASATLLIMDAWFDVTTSPAGWQMLQAVLSAVLIELPLAAMALYIARHVEVVITAAETRLRNERERLARQVRGSDPTP